MRNYISLGPVSIKISNRNLAWWGYERLRIGPLSFGSWANNGDYCLASFQKKTECWRWAVYLSRRSHPVGRAKIRRAQWHDYYWLPFGFRLVVSQQDFHK